MGILEREERERSKEIFEEIMAESSPKLMTDTKPQIQEAQRIPSRKNIKKSVQTAENQRENLERSHGQRAVVEIPYLQRRKDKNYIGFLFRDHVSKKRWVKYLNC